MPLQTLRFVTFTALPVVLVEVAKLELNVTFIQLMTVQEH